MQSHIVETAECQGHDMAMVAVETPSAGPVLAPMAADLGLGGLTGNDGRA